MNDHVPVCLLHAHVRSVIAMASRKRKAEDEWEVSDVEETGSATVHGVVSEVSPVKVSRRTPAFDISMVNSRMARRP